MGFVAGNDETFAVLMCVLVGCFNLVLWIPWAVRSVYRCSPLCPQGREWRNHYYDWWARWYQTIKFAINRPSAVKLGWNTMKQNRKMSWEFMWPRVKMYFSWHLIFAFIFIALLSVVAYQKVTFDPYRDLGLEDGADMSAVKKAYRMLSMKYHPDKDPSEEARRLYRNIRRAYKALTNPDKWEQELQEEAREMSGMGVALPTLITDPEYAHYSMTIIMLLMVTLPCWMIYKLLNRTRNQHSIWITFRKLAGYHQMTSSFYVMLGQPDSAELRYQREERVRLCAMVQRMEKNIPPGGIFRDPEGIISPNELSTQDIFAYFCPPEVGSRVELRRLFAEAVPGSAPGAAVSPFGNPFALQGSAGSGSDEDGKGRSRGVAKRGSKSGAPKSNRQHEAMTFLTDKLLMDPDVIPHCADYLRNREPPPTEAEVREAEQYRRWVGDHNDGLKLTDPELTERPYKAPVQDDIDVAQYYLFNILWALRWHVQHHVPHEQGRRPMFDKLLSIHKEKTDELESARKQADLESKEGKAGQPMSTQMRKILVRVANKDTALEKELYQTIDEVKQMSRRWQKAQMAHHTKMQQEFKKQQQMMMKKSKGR